MAGSGAALSPGVRAVVADAWAMRRRVEREAELRFARLAGRLVRAGAPLALVELARKASTDEGRHARLCDELATGYGAGLDFGPALAPEVAPEALRFADQVLYEVFAACAVTETESVSVLTSLLPRAQGRVEAVLRELARDEVDHARLGWAFLEAERARRDVAFLGRWLPTILEGTVDRGLFAPAPPEREDELLLAHGVLTRSEQRETFAGTLEQVVFPGLERAGIDAAPGRAWLAKKLAALAPISG